MYCILHSINFDDYGPYIGRVYVLGLRNLQLQFTVTHKNHQALAVDPQLIRSCSSQK